MLLAGGWLVFMPLAGAVVVPGNLVVQSNVKQIQHPTGGVVAEIKVRNGTRVSRRRPSGSARRRPGAGQPSGGDQTARRDPGADSAAAWPSATASLKSNFPLDASKWSNNGDIAKLLASEESLFKARAGARQSQKDLLQSQAAQLAQQITGFEVADGFQGAAAGIDPRRARRRPGPVRQAAGAADATDDAAARSGATRRRTRSIDVVRSRRPDRKSTRPSFRSSGSIRTFAPTSSRNSARRRPRKPNWPSATSRRSTCSTGSKSARRRPAS